MHRTCLLFLLGFIFVACESPIIYDHYQKVEQSEWSKEKVFYFTFNIEDIEVPYNISLNIRNNNQYLYRNLWLLTTEERPLGALSRDTINCVLADEFGKWTGKGISIFHSTILLRQAYSFPMKGQYTFGIRQGMRNEMLEGIEKIGLQIEVAK